MLEFKGLTNTYCAMFTLEGSNIYGEKVIYSSYSEHVYIVADPDGIDYMHFSADCETAPIGELCQVVADLGGAFQYNGWFDAYVPMSRVRSVEFDRG